MKSITYLSIVTDEGFLHKYQFESSIFLGDALTVIILNYVAEEAVTYLDCFFDIYHADKVKTGGKSYFRRRKKDCFEFLATPLCDLYSKDNIVTIFCTEGLKSINHWCRESSFTRILAWNLQCDRVVYDELACIIYEKVIKNNKLAIKNSYRRKYKSSVLGYASINFVFIYWGRAYTLLMKKRYKKFNTDLPYDVIKLIAKLYYDVNIRPLLQYIDEI